MTIKKAKPSELELTRYLTNGDVKYQLDKEDEFKIFEMKEHIDKELQRLKKVLLKILLINALSTLNPDAKREAILQEVYKHAAILMPNPSLKTPITQQIKDTIDRLDFIYDHYIKEVLYLANIGLLISISKSVIHNKNLPSTMLFECIQAGYDGLIEGIRRFDFRRLNKKTKSFYKFSTNATWWIKQRIQAYLTASGQLIQTPQYIKANKNKKNKALEINKLNEENTKSSRKQIAKRMQEKSIEKMSNYESLDKIELTKELQYKMPQDENTPESIMEREIIRKAFSEVFEKYLTQDEIIALCYMKGYSYKNINPHGQELHAKQISSITGLSVQKINGLLYSAKKRINNNKDAFNTILEGSRDGKIISTLDKWYYDRKIAEIMPLNGGDKDLVLIKNDDGSLKELRALLTITDPYDITQYIARTKEYKKATKSSKRNLKYVVFKDGKLIIDIVTNEQLKHWYSKYTKALISHQNKTTTIN